MPFPQLVIQSSGGGVATVANYAALPASAADGDAYHLEDCGQVVAARNLSGQLWWLPSAWAELPAITTTRLTRGVDDLTTLAAAGWTWDVGAGSVANASDGLGGVEVNGDVNTRLHLPVPSQTRVVYLLWLDPVSETGGGRAWLQAIDNPLGRRVDAFLRNSALDEQQRVNSSATLLGPALPCAGQATLIVDWSAATARSGLWSPQPWGTVPQDYSTVERGALEGTSATTRVWVIGAYAGRTARWRLRAAAALDATGL